MSGFDKALRLLKPGQMVFVPGNAGESLAFYEALAAEPDRAAGLTFAGAHFPGVNTNDYLALGADVRQRAYFMRPEFRQGLADRRVDLMPVDYPRIYDDLAERAGVDVALAMVSPPDSEGRCSLGPTLDFLPAIWRKAKIRIAHINSKVPRTFSSFSVDLADCDAVVDEEQDLLAYDTGSPAEELRQLAGHVCTIVRDGDTLQFGIGKLQAAALEALADRKRLRIFSGMVSDPVLGLLQSGAVSGEGAILTGSALGMAPFYERLAGNPVFRFEPVSVTHSVRIIAEIENFVTINSAIEIDLFGQVNVEAAGGRLMAGVGGGPAYVKAAQMSPGGRSVTCLTATAQKGKVSRVVPRLGKPGLVGVPRHDADYVATEFGIAQLSPLSVDGRAEALIGLAAPQFRAGLEDAWRQMRAAF